MDWIPKPLKDLGQAIYKATPLDNLVNAGRYAVRGDWGGVAGQLGRGMVDVAMLTPMGRAARVATLGARAAGVGRNALISAAVGMGVDRFMGAGPARAASSGAGGGYAGGLTRDAQGRLAPSAANFRMVESGDYVPAGMAPAPAAATTGGGGGGTAGGGYRPGRTPKYESVLPNPDAALLQQIQAARATAGADYRDMMNQIQAAQRNQEVAAQANLRAAGASATGQRQDLGSMLSEFGYGGSPAQAGVGQEAISQAEALQRTGIRNTLSDFLAQSARQRAGQGRTLSDALMRLAAAESAGRLGASQQAFDTFFRR